MPQYRFSDWHEFYPNMRKWKIPVIAVLVKSPRATGNSGDSADANGVTIPLQRKAGSAIRLFGTRKSARLTPIIQGRLRRPGFRLLFKPPRFDPTALHLPPNRITRSAATKRFSASVKVIGYWATTPQERHAHSPCTVSTNRRRPPRLRCSQR